MFDTWLASVKASVGAAPNRGAWVLAWIGYGAIYAGAKAVEGFLRAIGWGATEMWKQMLEGLKSFFAPLLLPIAVVVTVGLLGIVMTPEQLAPPLATAAVLYFAYKKWWPKKKKKKKKHS